MKVAVIYNKKTIDPNDVINILGIKTKEFYNPKTVEKVASALEKGGHSVKIIEGNMQAMEEIQQFMPRVMEGERPGMVFNMAYGIQGKNRYTHVPALMEMLGIPYVGSGPEAHAVVQDKVMTKIVLQKNNIPTPNFWVFSSPEDRYEDLTFPVIVKPKMESTSMGMKVVDNWDDLKSAVSEQIEKFQQDILVEQFIAGREFAVGIIGNPGNIEVLPIVELDLRGDPNRIQTKQDKINEPLEKICPANLSEETQKEMKRLCVEAYTKLGLNDFARVDIRMDKDEKMYILELNSMASLGLTGTFVHAAKTAGYTYESLINKIFEVAALRYFGDSYLHPTEVDEKEIQDKPLRTIARSYIRSHITTFEKLLRQVVNINTSPHNIDAVNRLGELLTKRLVHLGFKRHVFAEFDVGNILFFTNHESDQNDVLFLSHLDTGYSNRDFAPFHQIGTKLYGSGIAEGKGGIVTLVAALQALRFSRRIKKAKIGILLTTDDNLGGKYSKQLVENQAKNSKYVIELKSGTTDGGVVTSCSGITDYNIEMSHTFEADPSILHVIPEMCRKVISWKKISEKEKDARLTITEFIANTSYGRAPDYGRLSIQSRYILPEQGEKFDREIRKIAKKRGKVKIETNISKIGTRKPVIETEIIKNFFEMVNKLAKKTDMKLKPIHRYAPSDMCVVPKDIPVLGGMGPVGDNQRTPNEYILRDSIIDRATLLALLINKCRSNISGR